MAAILDIFPMQSLGHRRPWWLTASHQRSEFSFAFQNSLSGIKNFDTGSSPLVQRARTEKSQGISNYLKGVTSFFALVLLEKLSTQRNGRRRQQPSPLSSSRSTVCLLYRSINTQQKTKVPLFLSLIACCDCFVRVCVKVFLLCEPARCDTRRCSGRCSVRHRHALLARRLYRLPINVVHFILIGFIVIDCIFASC